MLFEKLEWLTVYNRINYHKASLMFKCINNLAPEYLCSTGTCFIEKIYAPLLFLTRRGHIFFE
jgi:hypothetical protein